MSVSTTLKQIGFAYWEVEGEVYSPWPVLVDSRTNRERWYQPNFNIMCQQCGKVWGRVVYDYPGVELKGERWFMSYHTCRDCKSYSVPPLAGCLWVDWNTQWNGTIPYELLKREVILLGEQIDGTNS